MVAIDMLLAIHPQLKRPNYSIMSEIGTVSYLREDSPGIYSAIAHSGEVLGQLSVPNGIGRACIREAFDLTIVKAGSPQDRLLAEVWSRSQPV